MLKKLSLLALTISFAVPTFAQDSQTVCEMLGPVECKARLTSMGLATGAAGSNIYSLRQTKNLNAARQLPHADIKALHADRAPIRTSEISNLIEKSSSGDQIVFSYQNDSAVRAELIKKLDRRLNATFLSRGERENLSARLNDLKRGGALLPSERRLTTVSVSRSEANALLAELNLNNNKISMVQRVTPSAKDLKLIRTLGRKVKIGNVVTVALIGAAAVELARGYTEDKVEANEANIPVESYRSVAESYEKAAQ